MKKSCKDCLSGNCGIDQHTFTKYKMESCAGNRLKVILLQIYDLSSEDGLQIAEIKSLLNTLVDEHFTEIDRK